MQHTREWYGLTDMFQAAQPGHGPFQTQAKTGVRDCSKPAQVQIPLKGFLGQLMLINALLKQR